MAKGEGQKGKKRGPYRKTRARVLGSKSSLKKISQERSTADTIADLEENTGQKLPIHRKTN
jgi:hypothetical protein